MHTGKQAHMQDKEQRQHGTHASSILDIGYRALSALNISSRSPDGVMA
jgi:hypothetical protein